MKHIQTYTVQITARLHEGPVDDGVDVDKMSEDNKILILQWLEAQGFEARVSLTSHDNEYTPEEEAVFEAEGAAEYKLVEDWETALVLALRNDSNFKFDGKMKGVYHYADEDGNDNNMDFKGPLTYRSRLEDGTFEHNTLKGEVLFTCKYQTMADKRNGKYYSAVINNPTFLDLVQVFEEMLRYTGDYHHIFYEGLSHEGERTDDVNVYDICTGS